MKLKHRLLVFAALGPAASFAVMAVEVLVTMLVRLAFGLAGPPATVGQSIAALAHDALSPAAVIVLALFAGLAALSGLAVELAERHETTAPALALAACLAAVTLMAIAPGFFAVLVFASRIGGVVAGLIAGAGAAFACWLVSPAPAGEAPAARPRSALTAQYAPAPGQSGAVFGRR